MTDNLMETVPVSIRNPLPGYQTLIPGLVPLMQDSNTVDEIVGFISGALEHQERLHDDRQGWESKVFRGTPKRIEIVKRMGGNDFHLGSKAVIHFEAESTGGKTEMQDITTGWIEYHGFDPHLVSFEVALSRTVMEIAEANIGNECFLRKAFRPAETSKGGDKVRFLANIVPVSGGRSAPKGGGRGGRGGDREEAPSRRRGGGGSAGSAGGGALALIERDREAFRAYGNLRDDGDAILAAIDAALAERGAVARAEEFTEQLERRFEVKDLTAKEQRTIRDACEEDDDAEVAASLLLASVKIADLR